MSQRPIGVGVVGLGFMGGTHVAAYRSAHAAGHPNRLVAVCDSRPERLSGEGGAGGNIETGSGSQRLDSAEVRSYQSYEAFLADPDVSAVSICTPTDSHVDLALAALRAGKHVLVEKPVAVAPDEVERLEWVARESGTVCMPAHCIRFWPAWAWLLDAVRDGRFGSVRSAVFRRLATPPAWSQSFYEDTARSGGALFDLHIHDTDFVLACFGPPEAVSSTGSSHHVTTLYRYPDGPAHVVAEGGWDHSQGFPFRMQFTVVFEDATADYAHLRQPELQLFHEGEARAVETDGTTGYDEEVRHFLDAIARGTPPAVGLAEALATARTLVAERASLSRGGPVEVNL